MELKKIIQKRLNIMRKQLNSEVQLDISIFVICIKMDEELNRIIQKLLNVVRKQLNSEIQLDISILVIYIKMDKELNKITQKLQNNTRKQLILVTKILEFKYQADKR